MTSQQNYQKMDAPCLLLQVQGGDISYIRKGDVFTIGRSKTNDLVFNDPTVSRSHATIRWEGQFPSISDNGSTAGLWVDGEEVEKFEMPMIHLIALGGVKLVAEYSPGEASTPTQTSLPLPAAVLNSLDDINDVVLFLEHGVKDINGLLNTNQKIQDLLLNFENSRRSGTLMLDGEMAAEIIFALGKIVHVTCGDITGENALRYICSFSKATYNFTVKMRVEGGEPLNLSVCCYLRSLRRAATVRNPK